MKLATLIFSAWLELIADPSFEIVCWISLLGIFVSFVLLGKLAQDDGLIWTLLHAE